MPLKPPRLLIVVNVGWFFLSHRLPVALAAKRAGYDVHVACGVDAEEEARTIRSYGIEFHRLSLQRANRSPLSELRVLRELLRLYRSVDPQVVHHVTIKPVLYGGMICRAMFRGRIVQAISGLGYLFTTRSIAGGAMRRLAKWAYRVALSGKNTRVIFQNRDDMAVFVSQGLVPGANAVLIRGSGVDLERFRPVREAPGPVTVLLPARMLRDKGVYEFLGAAAELRKRNVSARFVLAGGIDSGNPEGIPVDELQRAAMAAGVEWWGQRSDMVEVLASAHIVCLPSYREGLPMALLEAAAAGKPMVATNVPGCREVVLEGITGLLVPPRQVLPLADCLQTLIGEPALRMTMGQAARRLCEAEFGVESVVRSTLELYEGGADAG